jgi:hypothetical protein
VTIETVKIEARFNGPAQSANGGWTGGMLARRMMSSEQLSSGVDLPSISVSLRAPPPLNEPLQIHQHSDGSASLKHGNVELAHAQSEAFNLVIPSIPSLSATQAASALGLQRGLLRQSWPYAKCFACGVSRDDGLCITPSPYPGSDQQEVVAATWRPSSWLAEGEGQVRLEAIWAALDCPAGIAWSYQLPDGSPMVTARMSVSIKKIPIVNQTLLVLGWPVEREGRKLYAGTALASADGELLASSRQLWLLPRSN